MSLEIKPFSQGVRFRALIQPRASKNQIAGIHNGALKIRLTSAPVDGAANKTCIKFLAKELSISASRLSLVSGLNSRNKIIQVDDILPEEFMEKITHSLSIQGGRK